MNRLAGFRTRSSDRIVFIQPGEMTDYDPADWQEVFSPEQVVWVGDAPFEPGTKEPHQAGEWGRVGPPSSTAKPKDLASISADEPLSEEDALARTMIAARPSSGLPTNSGTRRE